MGHLETWPPYYEPGVTYVPYKWDFSDMGEVLARAAEPGCWREIAENGRRRYLSTISGDAEAKFCERLEALVSV
jgi:hypothetical protein